MDKVFHYLIWLFLLFMFVSCRASRDVRREDWTASMDSMISSSEQTRRMRRVIDSTTVEMGKVTLTDVIFFGPDDMPGDGAREGDVHLPAFGDVKGSIKEIRQTVIERDVERNGKSEESEDGEERRRDAELSERQNQIQRQESMRSDAFNNRMAFGLFAFSIAVLLYLKRVPIVDWIKKILAGLRKVI